MKNSDSLYIGHYKLKKQLEDSNYGKVYLAQDTILNREVAVKVLNSTLLPDPTTVERFKSEVEAKGLTQLQHPNIVQVLSVEDDPLPPYIVMEFVDGTSLATYRLGGGSLKMMLSILRQVASAIDAAHARGIVHGNLNPSNILITDKGEVKLTDFGLIQALQAAKTKPSLDPFGRMVSMTSEQVQEQQRIKRAADIYALDVISYQMLVGQVPLSALNKQPSEPYTSANSFLTALEESLASQSRTTQVKEPKSHLLTRLQAANRTELAKRPPTWAMTARSEVVIAKMAAAHREMTEKEDQEPAEEGQNKRWPTWQAVLAVVLLLLLCIAGSGLWWYFGRAEAPPPPPAAIIMPLEIRD